VPFQRMREARPREAHEVTMMLPHAQKVCFIFSGNRNFPLSAVFFTTGHDARFRHCVPARGASPRLGTLLAA
jgi:hypothetical protein